MAQHRENMDYGSWPSPITAARLVEGAAAVGEIRVDGDTIWWNEMRPSDGGRTQLVARTPSGHRRDLFDREAGGDSEGRPWNVRTAVTEYGGGAWSVHNGLAVFAHWDDQRLYAVEAAAGATDGPRPISPVPTTPRGLRWSEPVWLDDDWLVCVRESHEPDVVAANGEATNELVALPVDGSAVGDPSRVRVLVTGPDFVQSPAPSNVAHGPATLAWVQWNHPHMPWTSSALFAGTIERNAAGEPTGLSAERLLAGGGDESIVQPGFTATGDLVFCTDRTGWWNPWRIAGVDLRVEGVSPPATPVIGGDGIDAEIGGGLWVGGLRWWAERPDGSLVASAKAHGRDRLVMIGPAGVVADIDTPFTEIAQVVAGNDGDVLVLAASAISETGPYLLRILDDQESEAGDLSPAVGDPGGRLPTVVLDRLRPQRDLGVDQDWFSRPEHISFPSAGGRTAHALYYAPHHPEVEPTPGTKPPVVVTIHGGPTSAARNRLDLSKQFWTTRGVAVVDVNYGGSTGYGRPYRELLDGAWGVVDVEDAVAAAQSLADRGQVDGARMAIRGHSAGGYTTLAALCFADVFSAGASHFGVADLAALATDTHKFESRYLDGLVGPWPDETGVYAERSPAKHTEGFDTPLIVLQGSEDEVVPPNQAEMIVSALAEKGVPHAYLLFEGEQHGFRQAVNIVRAQEAELWFYGRVFGFEPADAIEPVDGAVGL